MPRETADDGNRKEKTEAGDLLRVELAELEAHLIEYWGPGGAAMGV